MGTITIYNLRYPSGREKANADQWSPAEPSCQCRGEGVTLRSFTNERALMDDVSTLARRDAAIRTFARVASWTELDRLSHTQC